MHLALVCVFPSFTCIITLHHSTLSLRRIKTLAHYYYPHTSPSKKSSHLVLSLYSSSRILLKERGRLSVDEGCNFNGYCHSTFDRKTFNILSAIVLSHPYNQHGWTYENSTNFSTSMKISWIYTYIEYIFLKIPLYMNSHVED